MDNDLSKKIKITDMKRLNSYLPVMKP